MLVFTYPRAKHVRTRRPAKEYQSLRSLRPFVKAEFANRCVYCRLPNFLDQSGAFSVDHYRPKALFSELRWEYSNLFWACHACNSRKREYWPAPDKELTDFLPNPCEHRMLDHLKVDGGRINHRTRAGEVAILTLELNSDARLKARGLLQAVASNTDSSRKRVLAAIARLEANLGTESDQVAKAKLSEKIQKMNEKVAEFESILDRIVDK